MRMLSALVLPLRIAAADRRSSILELVHEPRKTVSTLMSFILVPTTRSMYSSALTAAAFSLGSANESGEGTTSFSETP